MKIHNSHAVCDNVGMVKFELVGWSFRRAPNVYPYFNGPTAL